MLKACRQWRAREIFRTLRHTLVAAPGLEPSARIQHLRWAILNSDPRLDEPRIGSDLIGVAASAS